MVSVQLMSHNSPKHNFNLSKEAHFSPYLRAIPVYISSGLSVALLATISVLIAFGKDIKGEKIIEVLFKRTAWRNA